MPQTQIYAQDYEAGVRLETLGLTAGDLIEVVKRSVAARASAVSTFPANAAGQLSYIFGTAAIRDVLLLKGWQIDRTGNIEATYNPAIGIKIVFQNADSACEDRRDPKAISEKGPAASKAVDSGQMYLFPEIEAAHAESQARENASLWYFFVHINGDDVRAELSFPKSIEDRQFKGFNERVYVIKLGEWMSIAPESVEAAEPIAQDFDIEVTRKK
ncbi:hypothetical protein [Agrobacterium tumefaciens]|uniref:Uncharacterized protein n=1 Tax=Agrobacterium tumefaciens TaxID=358 RepID=A0A4D7Z407_AGRTU|nr:hypothetical protein [Agrobacterium tumefaciens]QCL97659.1 hypothetical protein CFBP7129_25835 [Agrobacterium tumefaciens]